MRDLKMVTEDEERTSCGRAFQTEGPEKEKDRSPKERVETDGRRRVEVSEDERS